MTGRLGTVLRLAIGLGVLAFLVLRVDLEAAGKTLARAHPGWLLAAFVAQLGSKSFWLARWHVLLVAAGHRRPPGELLRLVLIGLFFNNFLPSSVGGDVARGLGLTGGGVSRAAAAASVLVDRVVGVLALAILAVLGGALGAWLWPGEGPWAAAGAFALLTVALLVGVSRPKALAVFARVRGVPEGIARRLRRLLDSLTLLAGRTRELLNATALSLGLAGCSAIFHWAVARSLGIEVPILAWFVLVPMVMLFAALPLTVNGLGLREMGFVGLLEARGVAEADAIVFAGLSFVIPLVFAVAGGVLFLIGRRDSSGNAREAAP